MPHGSSGFPEPGADLGPFRLGRRLGAGGMGVVHEALDTQLNRHVALKIIAPHLADDVDFRRRFTREARAQASLDSPHVVAVHAFGEAEGRLYIASQLIPDGDLGRMLHRHGIPPPRVGLHLIAQVADGLADAHAAGLVHRDIKPANVLLRHRDHALHAYLTDFGIARRVGGSGDLDGALDGALDGVLDGDGATGLTRAGAAVGTPAYMAPELHTGGEAGPACDLYSLGCLLWTTLSGAAPYAGGTDYQVVSGHVSGPVPQVEATGPLAVEVNRVLGLALAKDPASRYPSAAALRDDLRGVLRLPDDEQSIRPVPLSGAARAGATAPPTQQALRFHAPGPPTPTPWSVGALSQAPPAPGVRAQPPPPPARSRSARLWIPVAAGLLAAVVAGSLLLVILRGDPAADEAAVGPDRDLQAVTALSSAFAVQAGVGREAGECIARRVVDEVGVDALIDAGVIDEDLSVLEENLRDPELISTLFSASFACAGEG